MTQDELRKANELNNSLETLNMLRRIFCSPYPQVRKRGKSIVFWSGFNIDVSFAGLDKQTCSELKDVIAATVDKRIKEIKQEIGSI